MSVWKRAIVPFSHRVTGVSIRPSVIPATIIQGTTNKASAFHPLHYFRLSICSRSINNSANHAPTNSSKDSHNNQLPADTTPESTKTLDPRLSEWIPPERPLVGDKGFSHLYKKDQETISSSPQQHQQLTEEEELKLIEQEVKLLEDEAGLSAEEQLKRIEQELKIIEAQEEEAKEKAAASAAASAAKKRVVQPQRNQNWLQTRQEKLGDDYVTPSYDRPGQELPELHHTLLTAQEIMDFLSSLGGMDPKLVHDQVMNEHGDTRLGGAFRGIVFVSGNSSAHARMMANSLVDQMKRRKLQEVGVMGARYGAAGGDDASETWFSIDCHNYIVNVMDEPTRRMLNLEEWWSQADPMAEVNALHLNEEDAMDEFVARNPVPPDYGRGTLRGSSGTSNWSDTMSDLQHKRWTVPHRAVVQRPTSNRGRKKKAKGKRR